MIPVNESHECKSYRAVPTDKQTDRQTEGQTDRRDRVRRTEKKNRQTGETDREKKYTEIYIDRVTEIHAKIQIGEKQQKQTDNKRKREKKRQADIPIDRQTDRQTEIPIDRDRDTCGGIPTEIQTIDGQKRQADKETERC